MSLALIPINWRSRLKALDGDMSRIGESLRAIAIDRSWCGRGKPLPDHLPREDVLTDTAGDVCSIVAVRAITIGESVSEMLD